MNTSIGQSKKKKGKYISNDFCISSSATDVATHRSSHSCLFSVTFFKLLQNIGGSVGEQTEGMTLNANISKCAQIIQRTLRKYQMIFLPARSGLHESILRKFYTEHI